MNRGIPHTDSPFTYVIDYGLHLNAPEAFIQEVAQAPPHLLHVAYDVLFHNRWGPFYQPRSSYEPPARLSPADVWERIALIRGYVDRLHQVGVNTVVPYICNQTLGGDPDRRSGIWEFYDHWDEYRDFDFGDRPEADPIAWMARERNGRVHYNYERRHKAFVGWGEYRYAPCTNNPDYNRYQRGLVANIAKVGYDGVFVDNNILNCYCPTCQERFRGYLDRRYTRAELRERLGSADVPRIELGHRGSRVEWVKEDPDFREFLRETEDPEELDLVFGTPDPDKALIEEAGNGWLWGRAGAYGRYLTDHRSPEWLTRRFGAPDVSLWGIRTPEERALWSETKRFWAEGMQENLDMVRGEGAAIRGDFVVLPNWGAMQRIDGAEYREEHGKDVGAWAPGCDLLMFEEDGSPGRVALGLYLDYILPRKFAFALGVSSGNLCYCGSGDGSAELAHAEAAIGGGGCLIHLGTGHSEIRAKYNLFFEEHRDLLAGFESFAHVGLVFSYDQFHMENLEHVRQTYAMTRYLLDQHVLFDYVVDGGLQTDRLSKYRALLLPEVRYLWDEEIRAVEAFVRQGGTVLLTGETAGYGRDGKPRTPPGFWRIVSQGVEEDGLTVAAPGGLFVHGRRLCDFLPEVRFSVDGLLGFRKWGLTVPDEVPDDGGYRVMAQADRVLRVDRCLRGGRLRDCLERSLGYDPAVAGPFEGAGVRFQAYWRRDGTQGRILLHVVNYNLPLTDPPDTRTVRSVENLKLRLKVPDGWSAVEGRALEPGVEPMPVAVEARAGAVEMVVPKIRYYKVLDLSAEVR